ncbi:bifunctional diguanylate cyclase/phosphodiesterase [Rhodopseudomonas sp. B29]|uniref:putative bifunctional diguanylate cyclase/phosphodiesterase n=1 Tax=Rhodopseudomonas sp. B29 TaxID=95607 RepID=UPI00034CE940|nr:EAL domain-containing protein [Rhodopseudomonas sp. B29]
MHLVAWNIEHIGLVGLGVALCLTGAISIRGALMQMRVAERSLRNLCLAAVIGASVGTLAGCAAVLLLLMYPTDTGAHEAAIVLTVFSLIVAAAVAVFSLRLGLSVSQQAKLRLAERKMVVDAIVHDDSIGFCMFDHAGRLQLWNEAFLDIYAVPPGRELANCRFAALLKILRASGSLSSDRSQLTEIRAAIQSGGPATAVINLRDGHHIRISLRRLANGGWIGRHEDITDHQQAEQRFAYLALHDIATGLPNRAALNARIVKNLELARATNGSFAVIKLGIDRFKEINDVFGQATGDAVLAEMARRLGETCHWGYLARPGGDEFSVVTQPDNSAESFDHIREQLQKLCDTQFEIDGHVIQVCSTAGVSFYPRDGEAADTLLAHADVALYRAKTEHRGEVCLFEPSMDLQIRDKRALQRELTMAVPNGEFEIHYQPQATAAGEIVGFEALLRWRHPVRGMVSPAVFVPLAEETGLIGTIDEWVLRSVCAEAASWERPLAIAVNFSPLDFRRFDVPALVLQVLLETGLEPKRLEIEITEGVLIEDFSGAIAILRRLKNLGVRVAMDDFGAGYSSLSYLQSFPFDKIKIDQAFTRKLETNPESAAIVEAILNLSRTLKLPVIAEGVETESQLAFLAKAGCDEVQGYLIGKPQPMAHYRHLVSSAAPAPLLAQAG